MLKAVFIGSNNEFNEMLVDWLARRVDLTGVVWTSATAWSKTWRGRLQFARKRLRRYGVLKTLDEMLFYVYYHAFRSRQDQVHLQEKLIEPYWIRHGKSQWGGDAISAANVNSEEVIRFLKERSPDIAFAMCINNYFGRRLRRIPRQGVFLWHEGITPQYRGLYSPFWAVHNLDFSRIGYTLLRMNDKYDAGEIFAQGRAREIDPRTHAHGYIGHKAIVDSLRDVEKLLPQLKSGSARPMKNQPNASDCIYTYPGLSDLIRQRLALRRMS